MKSKANLKIESVKISPMKDANLVIGQSHFIKTVEDLYEALATSSPIIKFGVAFNEASGPRLVRTDGNDDGLIKASFEIAKKIGCGHVFVVLMKNAYPINVLNRIKSLDEVVNVYVATANEISVIVADDSQEGRGVIGIIDGKSPIGLESQEDRDKRSKFLRNIGYKR